VEAPRTGRPAVAGPATAQAGAAAAGVVAAAARRAGDRAGAAQAAALQARLERLAVEDAEAYEAATAALPGPSPASADAKRDFALGTLLDRAAAVPLSIAEACADVALLARELADRLDPVVGPDLEASARLAAGAARGAAHLVEVNLAVGADDDRARRARNVAAAVE
jgi:formiminotetrahydrofolate cyclodeaminase